MAQQEAATHVCTARLGLLAAGRRILASRRRAGGGELGCELERRNSRQPCRADGMTSQRGKEGQLARPSARRGSWSEAALTPMTGLSAAGESGGAGEAIERESEGPSGVERVKAERVRNICCVGSCELGEAAADARPRRAQPPCHPSRLLAMPDRAKAALVHVSAACECATFAAVLHCSRVLFVAATLFCAAAQLPPVCVCSPLSLPLSLAPGSQGSITLPSYAMIPHTVDRPSRCERSLAAIRHFSSVRLPGLMSLRPSILLLA